MLKYYRLAIIEYINPKILITYIDGSSIVSWLCKNYKRAEFFAKQNGNRTNWELDTLSNKSYYMKHYFCFGNHDVERFRKK